MNKTQMIYKENSRIEWIDTLKGFAIVLVMFGHAIFPNFLRVELYSFHIPLFFFLSGDVFSIKKYNNFREFFVSKFKSLLIPLISFSIITFLFHLSFNYLIVGDMELKRILFELAGIIFQIRGTILGGSAWFLTCLFSTEVIFYFILKIAKNNNNFIIIILFISSIVGYLYFKFIKILLPWAIDASLTAIVFLGTNVDLYSCKLGIYLLYYCSSISGILMCICIFRLIKKRKILNEIGKNSLIYYCLHLLLFSVIKFALRAVVDLETKVIYEQFFIGLLMVIITSFMLWNISKLINKRFPFLLGKFQ